MVNKQPVPRKTNPLVKGPAYETQVGKPGLVRQNEGVTDNPNLEQAQPEPQIDEEDEFRERHHEPKPD
jgi:hypothetical protein